MLSIFVVFAVYATHEVRWLEQFQGNVVQRNRKASLQLLRLQSDIYLLAISLREMNDSQSRYPIPEWEPEFNRLHRDMDDAIRLETLRNRLETGLRQTPGVIVFSEKAPRLPNTTLFTVPGLKAETAVIAFDLAVIAVSSGSACSSGKVQPSHVLQAMGFGPELARGAVRLSLGWSTLDADIDRCLEAWRKLSGTLLKGGDETLLEGF